ncbi:Hypothetical predicted protein [Paramuricea clavata]|uniref:Uncharacterized protein n=1 Tax=Paramuricea clavata TaxID=317549 RepID=A0A6S7ICK1_PARCT|nr:Hypothetical predicted protein [Paramuricea clavata]
MNKQHVTLLVFLDLSAAFDTVDHDILLRRLKYKFGICNNALAWFRSYLVNRSHRVVIENVMSDSFDMKYGVAQRYCLGPLLFILYTSKLFDVIHHHLLTVHCFADDTELYLAFNPSSDNAQDAAILAMENCLRDIRNWMITDRLMINDEKTEFMLIGTKAQLAKVKNITLTIGESTLSTLGDRAFMAGAPKLWNVLPLNLRSISDFNIFKHDLKTYLFKEAFY